MSIILDKGRFKLIYETENKQKPNYSLSKKASKNKNPIKQPQTHLLKAYMGLSPNNHTKKKPLIKSYNNSTLSHVHNIKNCNKKNTESKQLKYNRSFEGGLLKNELAIENNEIELIKNKELNKFNNTNREKNKSNSNINRTQAFSSVNKSKTNNRINNKPNKNIIKRLDEKFKSLENNIIDKKYENVIDHDEMIITTNKKPEIITKSIDSKNNSNYLYNIININNNIDENLINSSFENNKNDFKIMYVENYADSVPNDMLILEIKLIFEKILELQKSYHKELDSILIHYFSNKNEYKNSISKYDLIQKKIILLQKFSEKKNREENQNCFDIYNKKNFQEINDINKKEIGIWKLMMNSEENEVKAKDKKIKLKEIFKICIFEKYYKIKNMSDLEKKIIENLMKKFKYVLQSESEINKIKNNKSNNSLKKYNNKKILSPISQSKNINYFTNNKFKNKKLVNFSYKSKK